MGIVKSLVDYFVPSLATKGYEENITTKSWEELRSNTLLMTSSGSPGTLAPTLNVTQTLNKYRDWVYPCVDIIKKEVADIPFYLYKEKGEPNDEEFDKILDHPIIKLLNKPNKFMSGKMFRQVIQMHLDLAGMAFARILRNAVGQPAELHILYPQELVNIEFGNTTDDIIKKFTFGSQYEQSKRLDLYWQDVLYFWYPHPLHPYRPCSPMQSLCHITDMGLYMQVYQNNFFQNNARPDFVILVEKDLNAKTAERIGEGWASKFRGPGKQHKPAVLGPNVKIQPLGIPAKDFEFAALSEFGKSQILAHFHVPEAKLGIVGDYSKAGIVGTDTVFAKECLSPRLSIFTDVINNQLLPQYRSTDGMEFRFDSPLPKDEEWDFTKNQGELTMGLTTLNEIRKKQGRKVFKSKLADVPWVNGMPLPGEDKEADTLFKEQNMGGAAGAIPGMEGAIPGMEGQIPPELASDPNAQGDFGALGGRPEGTALSSMLNEALRGSKPTLSALLNAARGKRGGLSSLVESHPEMTSFRALLAEDQYRNTNRRNILNKLLSKGIYDYIDEIIDEEDKIIYKVYEEYLPLIDWVEESYRDLSQEFFVQKGIEFGQIVQKALTDYVEKGAEGDFDIDEETLKNDYKQSAKHSVTSGVQLGFRMGYDLVSKSIDIGTQEDPEKASIDAAGRFLDRSADLKVKSTKKALTKIIKTGIKEGLDSEDVSKMIMEEFKDIGYNRAEMIARTELAGAVCAGLDASYEDINKRAGKIIVTKSMFWAALDERTCEQCRDEAGEIVKDYKTGKEYREIPAHPRCRCLPKPMYN